VAEDRRTTRNSAFERLWLGTAAANLADGILLSAAPLLAATITRDPLLVAGLTLAQRLPWFVFTLISGALVDRLDRRRLLVAANAARALAVAVLAMTLATDVHSLAVLYVTVFALGVAETIEDTAALAVLPALVPRAGLERANGRIFATQSALNELIGPPVGGFLFALAAVASFATGAAAFTIAAIVLAGLPRRVAAGDAPAPEPLIRAIREGFRWFWSNSLIRTVALMAGAVNLLTTAVFSVLVLVGTELLGLDAAGYGLLLAGAAVGGVAGGLLAERLLTRLGSGPAIFLSTLLPGIAFLGIALIRDPFVAAALLSLESFAGMVGNVVLITLRQAAVPDHLLGRVGSAYRMIALGAIPVGALLGGVLARQFGLRAPFFVSAAALVLLAFALAPVLTTARIDRAGASLVET